MSDAHPVEIIIEDCEPAITEENSDIDGNEAHFNGSRYRVGGNVTRFVWKAKINFASIKSFITTKAYSSDNPEVPELTNRTKRTINVHKTINEHSPAGRSSSTTSKVKVVKSGRSRNRKVKSTAVEKVTIPSTYSRQHLEVPKQGNPSRSNKQNRQNTDSWYTYTAESPALDTDDQLFRQRSSSTSAVEMSASSKSNQNSDEDGVRSIYLRNVCARRREAEIAENYKKLELELDTDEKQGKRKSRRGSITFLTSEIFNSNRSKTSSKRITDVERKKWWKLPFSRSKNAATSEPTDSASAECPQASLDISGGNEKSSRQHVDVVDAAVIEATSGELETSGARRLRSLSDQWESKIVTDTATNNGNERRTRSGIETNQATLIETSKFAHDCSTSDILNDSNSNLYLTESDLRNADLYQCVDKAHRVDSKHPNPTRLSKMVSSSVISISKSAEKQENPEIDEFRRSPSYGYHSMENTVTSSDRPVTKSTTFDVIALDDKCHLAASSVDDVCYGGKEPVRPAADVKGNQALVRQEVFTNQSSRRREHASDSGLNIIGKLRKLKLSLHKHMKGEI